MDPLVGDGEAEEVRRPLSVFKRFYNFLRGGLHGVLVTFYTLLLGFVFDQLAFFIPQDALRRLFNPLMRGPPIYGTGVVKISGYYGRVKSKNLVTKCLIGKGSSGIFYETTWLGCSQGSPGRLARKDFPGVKGDIFEREVIPLFELPDHPNLLKTLCWTVDSRSCSLVLEYMQDDLCSVVRRRKEELRKKHAHRSGMGPSAPFKLHEALEIAIQIATGMEYLHLKGITHGDLKANNVFIDWTEDKMLVKLADFGLLQTKRRSTMVSERAFCFQMMEWSAPELFEDYFRSDDLDYLWTKSTIELETSTSSVSTFKKYTEVSMKKADSYSFALIFAFVLGGQMWNAKFSPGELRREISNSGLRPKLPSECPETLRSLISLCWDAESEKRPTFSNILKILQEEQRNLQEGDLSSLKPKLEPILEPKSEQIAKWRSILEEHPCLRKIIFCIMIVMVINIVINAVFSVVIGVVNSWEISGKISGEISVMINMVIIAIIGVVISMVLGWAIDKVIGIMVGGAIGGVIGEVIDGVISEVIGGAIGGVIGEVIGGVIGKVIDGVIGTMIGLAINKVIVM